MIPLIAAQPGIYIADKLSAFDNAYTVVHYLDLRGQLNLVALQESIMQGMNDSDTLQMTYDDSEGEAVQIFRGPGILPHPVMLDFRSKADPILAAREYMEAEMTSSSRIDSGNPLIHHAILQTSANTWIWYQRYHHIQLDAYSFTALTRRIGQLYSARIRSQSIELPPFTPITEVVAEYVQYQNSPKYAKDAAFWKKYCAELPPAYSLVPVAGAEPSKNIVRNLRILNYENFQKLCKLGAPADMALALVSLWMMRLCNCDAMSMGFILMRRLGSSALNAAGAFINVLPIALVSGESITDLADNISKSLKTIRRHQKFDSEQIVRDTGRSWEKNPLFGPVINFKAFDYRLDFEGLETETHHIASGPIRDIELVIYLDDDNQLMVEYLANGDRYDKDTLDRHLERLDLLLSDPSGSLISPEETSLIDSVNSTEVLGHENETLTSLMQLQAQKTPTKIALRDAFGGQLTYAQCNLRVRQIALAMASKAGVQRGDIVAVELPRSLDLSLVLQAVLSLGAAYLPLDSGYPRDRINMMVEDAQPKLIITVDNIKLFDLGDVVTGNDISARQTPTPDDIAYIIYTSGSTGRPKGVMVSHRAIVNRLLWMQHEYRLTPNDVVLQKTPSSFDVSVWEFFWPLISGACCLMAPPDAHRDPEHVRQLIVEFQVTTIHFVPSMLSTFLNSTIGIGKSLKRTFCSGEALPVSLARSWQEATGVPLYNLYGPTEAAIDVSAYPAYGDILTALRGASVPIGLPVWNTKIYVLDSKMRMLPPNLPGDLYIGGVQLARGYWNRQELTAERFIIHKGERLYRTGDVARWSEDGALEFLGRSDDQVKLRGQRIELGEIDAAMESLSGVSQAVTQPQVLASSQDTNVDSRQLVGYLVVTDDDFDIAWAQSQLSKILPPQMVPVKLVIMKSFPLNASGKLDRKSLPSVATVESERCNVDNQNFRGRQPAPGLEQVIAHAYESLLNIPYVTAEDDFFSLGGHSLLAVKLAAQLRGKLNIPVTIGQIMQAPRVDRLAHQLDSGDSGKNAGFETVLPLRPTELGPTVFCIHPASGFAWQFSVLRRYLDSHWSLIGIQSTEKDGAMGASKSLEDVVEAHYHTITKYEPEGPYYLLGYSLGGTLAHSLAARLTREGKKVNFLGLLDTWPPETQNWDAKRGENVLDQAVVDEMNRERQQFLTSNVDDGFSTRMFDAIEANYSTAVQLLVTARSQRFEGRTVLFVAKKTLPTGTDLQKVWHPWTEELKTVDVDCSHIDIIHPETFVSLGPQINDLLSQAQN